VNEGDAAFARNLLNGASDVDHGETATLYVADVTYAVDGGAGSGAAPAGISLGADGHTLTVDPTNPAFDHLAVDEHTTIVVSYNVTDAQGATVAQTETITISGTNDAPVVAAALSDNVNEGDSAFARNLLNGASDVDHGETATLYVADVTYAVDGGAGSGAAPAGISLGADGHTLTVDPTNPAFDHLAVDEHTTIVVSYNVTDAQGATVAQTETVTITGTNDAAPVIQTDLFTLSELGDGVTMVSGLYVTDADASETETFTFTATTGASPDSSVAPSIDPGDREYINDALDAGVTYNPGSSQQLTDSVTFKVTDGFGHSDTVNFIFNVTGESDVELTGTDGKDVIFATGNTDTLTGGAGADQFVFRVGDGNDTITDFTPGQDHIDLRAFFETINPETIDAWLHDHAAPSQNDPADMVLWLGGDDNVTLKQVASLTANDFILHPGIGN
ncbi:VCBS domain-containing protein, partial [Bradyrhizobium sp. JYMT SZCCT0428]|uniref:VCBS domain-containing protein n=1 Tax=Bradyrhizobium sp. JYMT SZCCT0428 TaxID=2807673 RepID=UPI001BA697CB